MALKQLSPNTLYIGDSVRPEKSTIPARVVAFGPKGAERVQVEFTWPMSGVAPLRRWYDWGELARG